MAKERLVFVRHENPTGKESFIDVDSNDEILPALQKILECVRESDNWECCDSFENKEEVTK